MTCSTFLSLSLPLLLSLLLSSNKTVASDVNQDESQGNHKRHGISNSFTERVLQQNYDKILRPYSFQGTNTHAYHGIIPLPPSSIPHEPPYSGPIMVYSGRSTRIFKIKYSSFSSVTISAGII